MIRRRTIPDLLGARGPAVDPDASASAARILADVEREGEAAARRYAEQFGEFGSNETLFLSHNDAERHLNGLPPDDRRRLERVAERIRRFAVAQRNALRDLSVAVPGGSAGHWVTPVERAGCYAPGGRYPLPSSALMTAVTARVAGVGQVWLASPRPSPLTLAAAALADVDGVLAIGGAQAIAALTFGCGPVPPVDVIAGPGNKYVTAAKQLVSHRVGIDMLAGPTELVVWADRTADPAVVAADLLAQAEHDPDAVPVLVTDDATIEAAVIQEIAIQLEDLPTADIARAALRNGGVVLVTSVEEAMAACDALAPEHLALHVRDPEDLAPRLRQYGALFVGGMSGEVLGDYGAGPNHVLPTGGSARWSGGLSVFNFLRVRSWLRIDDGDAAEQLCEDAAWLARAEGLEAHARSANRRAGRRARAESRASGR